MNDIAPSALTYLSDPATYPINSAIAANNPSNAGGAVVSYSVAPALPTGLSLDTSTGVISGTPTVITATANYTVTATNTGGNTTKAVSITITAAVAAPTGLTYTSDPATYTNGTAIASNSPSLSGGGAVTSYSVSPALPAGLSLNTSTGVITGTPTAVTATANYTVTASNAGGSTTKAVSITVNDVAPSALSYTNNSPSYTINAAITNNSPTSSGGAVVSYSVSPALPAGLTLSTTTGVISGTPTAVTASATYTVTATNSGGNTTKALTIAVNDVAPSALTYSADPTSYTINAAITANNPSSSGGAVVSYSVSPALPTGLSLNTTTGVITGTPTALTAAANYTVTATNSGGNTTKAVSIAVVDVPPSALTYTLNTTTYTAGTAIAANNPSSAGGPVVSYSVSPALPAGLSLNTTTGVISGTATATNSGATTYTVTATNTGGSTTKALSFNVTASAANSFSYSTTWGTLTAQDANPIMTVGNGDAFTIRFRSKDGANVNMAAGGMTVTLAFAADGTSAGTFGAVTDVGDGTYTSVFTATGAGTANSVNVTMNSTVSVTSTKLQIRVISGPTDAAYSANILAWYNAGSIGGNDAAVSTWADSSGNGYNATQATAANQPRVFSAGPNGKPMVTFYSLGVAANVGSHNNACGAITSNAGTWLVNDNLATALGANLTTQNYTSFVVARYTNVGDTTKANNYIFDFEDTAYAKNFRFFINGTALNCTTEDKKIATTWRGTNVSAAVATPIATLKNWNSYSFTVNTVGPAVAGYFNGGAATTWSGNGGAVVTAGATGRIGGHESAANTTTHFFDGDMAELILYKTVFTSTDRQALQDYLAAKYALTTPH